MAIDRTTRWVYMRSDPDQSKASSVDFLRRLQRVAPLKLLDILTDNGSQFTDRFTSKASTPSGRHVFDVVRHSNAGRSTSQNCSSSGFMNKRVSTRMWSQYE